MAELLEAGADMELQDKKGKRQSFSCRCSETFLSQILMIGSKPTSPKKDLQKLVHPRKVTWNLKIPP